MIIFYVIASLLLVSLLIINQSNYWKENLSIQLSWKREIVICLVCVGLSYASVELQKKKAENYQKIEIGSLDPKLEKLNPIDKRMIGQWNIEAKFKGKFFKNVAIYLIPLSLFFFAGSVKRRLALFFVFSQGYVLTESVTGLFKGLVTRYRPFAYMTQERIENLNTESKEKFLEDIVEYDIQNSFFSGDASITAFGFMFLATCYGLFYPSSKFKNGMCAVAIIATLLECYFRALSGKHFPSDVLIGALIGSVIAYGIVEIHRQSSKANLNS
jgi:membrane-associated phospholipid phosphatase